MGLEEKVWGRNKKVLRLEIPIHGAGDIDKIRRELRGAIDRLSSTDIESIAPKEGEENVLSVTVAVGKKPKPPRPEGEMGPNERVPKITGVLLAAQRDGKRYHELHFSERTVQVMERLGRLVDLRSKVAVMGTVIQHNTKISVVDISLITNHSAASVLQIIKEFNKWAFRWEVPAEIEITQNEQKEHDVEFMYLEGWDGWKM